MKGIGNVRSAILNQGEKYYTLMREVFHSIDNEQTKYNWLITDCVCYPIDEKLENLFSQKYIWISGNDLTEIIDKEDFQFVWGVFSGFSSNIILEQVLNYDFPYADGYEGFWIDNVSIQHPLADIEIVAWDSSLTIFISKEEKLVQKFMNGFPLSKDLSAENARDNVETNYI
jgi:hypothetical protein